MCLSGSNSENSSLGSWKGLLNLLQKAEGLEEEILIFTSEPLYGPFIARFRQLFDSRRII